MDKPVNFRTSWFGHVKKTREKIAKKEKRKVSHQEAMKSASESWPKEKAKLTRKHDREQRALKKKVDAK